ncbi:MAG TPA: MoaD/ThiS family protein [Planctomycetota bacterium]|jgi:sulfur carrier protein
MKIEVRLFATFREGRFSRQSFDVTEPCALRDLLKLIDIPEAAVHLPMVNGEYSTLARVLRDGDIVSLFPAVGGG